MAHHLRRRPGGDVVGRAKGYRGAGGSSMWTRWTRLSFRAHSASISATRTGRTGHARRRARYTPAINLTHYRPVKLDACWRSGPGPGRFPPPCVERSIIETRAAVSPAAACASARGIISATGRNLALLCRRHHRAVHEVGYQVARGPDGTLRFRRPDGRPLPEVPPPAAVLGDPIKALRVCHDSQGLHVNARTGCAGWLGERLNLGWAIDVLHPHAQKRGRGPSCGLSP